MEEYFPVLNIDGDVITMNSSSSSVTINLTGSYGLQIDKIVVVSNIEYIKKRI